MIAASCSDIALVSVHYSAVGFRFFSADLMRFLLNTTCSSSLYLLAVYEHHICSADSMAIDVMLSGDSHIHFHHILVPLRQ